MNGCYNRKELKDSVLVQDGWVVINLEYGLITRKPFMKAIADKMSKECQYQVLTKDDPNCKGCKWLM